MPRGWVTRHGTRRRNSLGPGGGLSEKKTESVIWPLIGVNALVYVLWHTWGSQNLAFMNTHFLVSWTAVFDGRLWTMLTSAFSHLDPMHLIFNMIGLYVFGRPVESVLGPVKMVALYVIGALGGSLAYVLWGWGTGSLASALGASGAVTAIALPYAIWFPRRTLLINFFIPVPAWLAVILFVGMDLVGMIGGQSLNPMGEGAGVAHAAHLGGAVVGLIVGLWVRRQSPQRLVD